MAGWLGHWMLQYSMICLMILVLIWDFWFGDDWRERERERERVKQIK